MFLVTIITQTEDLIQTYVDTLDDAYNTVNMQALNGKNWQIAYMADDFFTAPKYNQDGSSASYYVISNGSY